MSEAIKLLEQAEADGMVVGLKDVTEDFMDGVVPRLDIDVILKRHPDTFNLFLAVMVDFAADSAGWEDPWSYFQIAGIHGLPKKSWDGIDFPQKKRPESPTRRADAGYCAHGVNTFPTWHRPYLAMIEQTIYKRMLKLAEQYPNPQKHIEAAKLFRLPYWDYYRPRAWDTEFTGIMLDDGNMTKAPVDFRMPLIFTQIKVMISTPSTGGKPQLMDNPLVFYNFPEGGIESEDWDILMLDGYSRKRTQRYGGNGDENVRTLNNQLNVQELHNTINTVREDCTRLSLNMMELGPYSNYETFACQGIPPRKKEKGKEKGDVFEEDAQVYGSLEALHNTYHVLIGGSIVKGFGANHMSRVAVSAFDPVFWMHHCQIDRWLAIWQKMNPNSWFSDDKQNKEPLKPFRNTKKSPVEKETDYWTSLDCEKTEDFGYTYPDIKDEPNAPEMLARFKKRYEWSRRLRPDDKFGKPPLDMEPLDLSAAPVFDYPKDTPEAAAFNDISKTFRKPTEKLNIETPNITLPIQQQAVSSAMASQPEYQNIAATLEPSKIDESRVSREWFVDDVVERLALNGAFTIFYFVGPIIATEPTKYFLEPTLAGLNHIFAAPVQLCDSCGTQQQQAFVISNTTSITSMLLDYVKVPPESGLERLESMRPEHVEPFLIKYLRWRAVDVTGKKHDPRALAEKGYKLSVSCKVALLPPYQAPPIEERYNGIVDTIIKDASSEMTS
ncbi:hypothetical protein MMC18_009585 [Xylographa bjoerkii]|nr:hypothetical protein [Xylographa bjoerkii]